MSERERLDWPDVWHAMAAVIAQRSLCDRRQVGAIIVDFKNQIMSSTYNGPPSGAHFYDGCLNWCTRAQRVEESDLPPAHQHLVTDYSSCPSLHAEANALLQADRSKIEGGTIYVSSSVCMDCAKLIANSGLAEVEMIVQPGDTHRDPERVGEYLSDMGIKVWAHYPEQQEVRVYHPNRMPVQVIKLEDNDAPLDV